MSVRLDGNIVVLEGRCHVEDAEPLCAWLQADRNRIVSISGAEHLHAAVVQLLMALRPAIQGSSQDPFIRDWITPLLRTDAASGSSSPET